MKNLNLNRASIRKNDEFYTQFKDIEKELENYKDYFENKIVYCNCDIPYKSDFYNYFYYNFQKLKIKKLISSFYNEEQFSYKIEVVMKNDEYIIIKNNLKCNGDFRNQECIDILKEVDLVITNPPFSLFREYVQQLFEYKKQFLIVGNTNAISYREIFKLMKDNKIWLGFSPRIRKFYTNIEKKEIKDINGCWFTNLNHKKRNNFLKLSNSFNSLLYNKYDNYNAIDVSKLKDIPYDYDGLIGVPITFLEKYNPEQFQIIGSDFELKYNSSLIILNKEWNGQIDRGYINGKRKYARIFIKRM